MFFLGGSGKMIRRIGVDFGTSTTVLRVKDFEDDGKTPRGDRFQTQIVRIGGKDTVPTLIKKLGDGTLVFGINAEKGNAKGELFTGFKMDLIHPDEEKRKAALELTKAFYRYLCEKFRELNDSHFFGEDADRLETIVSYPVKWENELGDQFVEIAGKAGFPNVTGMNEAKAAVVSAALQRLDSLSFLLEGTHRVMLIDMGAGTTDIVIGDYSWQDNRSVWETTLCWPQEPGGFTCGGREVDDVLNQYLERLLSAYGAETGESEIYLRRFRNPKIRSQVRAWKEEDVSPELGRNARVTVCPVVTTCTDDDVETIEPITRESLEAMLSEYLDRLHSLICDSVRQVSEDQREIEAVILVGGGSQWYFVDQLLNGAERNGERIPLPLVERDPEHRIIHMPLPQEIVAQGLVLSALNVDVKDSDDSREAETPEPSPGARPAAPPEIPDPAAGANPPAVIPDTLIIDRDRIADTVSSWDFSGIPEQNAKQLTRPMPGVRLLEPDPKSPLFRFWEKNTLKTIHILPSAVYLFWDESLIGIGAGKGLLIANRGIFFRSFFGKVLFISWENWIAKQYYMDMKPTDCNLAVCGPEAKIEKDLGSFSILGAKGCIQLKNLINTLADDIREENGIPRLGVKES